MAKEQPPSAAEHRAIVILAAGQGTRMGEEIDKALVGIAGIPMLEHVARSCAQIPRRQFVIVRGHDQDVLEFPGHEFEIAFQEPGSNGTAAALIAATEHLHPEIESVIVLFADNPLLSRESIGSALAAVDETPAVIGLTTASDPEPGRRGRIIRRAGEPIAIRETAACDLEELRIQEFNCGAMALDVAWARDALGKLKPDPETGELYMTALIELAANEGKKVATVSITDPAEALGCDDFESLAAAEKHYFRRRAAELMKKGVRFRDPDSTAISADSEIGADTLIERNVSIEGRTSIGSNCRIGQDSVISDSQLADGCQVTSSRIIGSECGPSTSIGPNALIRDGTFIGEGAQAGNCVEVKNSRIGAGALIGHLCYVGDADVGPNSVIGAGAITCNFDGVNKHRTLIGSGAFIGSNVSLIAPIRVGDKAVVGAGSVVTRDVPEGVTVYGNPARPKTN
ncbi:MAG: bifunctional UDP-N-acetylglucosamine diphosphorylase/glucosamine-1-phosphate N-acetyltransferase GlmU [Chloroflexota bacterium]|nr:bifunctional UDP-N-acetylglucosamine diphosphorylase/glucosamine-1-phosphate N-acetyltransferase GlmU [Chloroflexota bacterium]